MLSKLYSTDFFRIQVTTSVWKKIKKAPFFLDSIDNLREDLAPPVNLS